MKRSNKTRKILGALLGLSLFLGGAAAAGDGEGHCKGPKDCSKRVDRMEQKLQLDEGQKAQFLAIFESYKPTMKSLKEQRRSTFTESQREALDADRKANKGKRERGKLGKEGRQARLDSLGVSEGQKQQLASIRQQMREQRKARRAELMATLDSNQQEIFKDMKGPRGKKRSRSDK